MGARSRPRFVPTPGPTSAQPRLSARRRGPRCEGRRRDEGGRVQHQIWQLVILRQVAAVTSKFYRRRGAMQQCFVYRDEEHEDSVRLASRTSEFETRSNDPNFPSHSQSGRPSRPRASTLSEQCRARASRRPNRYVQRAARSCHPRRGQ
ncbi:hypothetical protein C8Q77DRAFT_364145 [Trametes polyzona]|nr:hypothetical protein C8Q77DRAFT_364145 [Trametes polyzona]